MAIDEGLAERVRTALAHLPRVEEKRMFGGRAFLVDGKMCINVGPDRLMCRIDPALHDAALARDGCTTVTMGGRAYPGYVYVDRAALATADAFDHWIGLALAWNPHARASR